MNVRDLDGKIVKWNPSGTSSKDTRAKSNLHMIARGVLKYKYPTLQMLEEVSIPLRARKTVFLDFYCPLLKRAYEVHGEQHYKFVPHFHANIQAFAHQRALDSAKVEWCDINGIEVIELGFDTLEDWENMV
jgi:hypothetical protein